MNFIKRAAIIVSFLLALKLNIQIATSNNLSSDGTITVFGIELSLFTPINAGGGGLDYYLSMGPGCPLACGGGDADYWARCAFRGSECSFMDCVCFTY